MKWSKFNLLFNSKKYGWLLYNSARNNFMQFDDKTYEEILQITENINGYDFNKNPGLYLQLRINGVVVEDDFDENYINKLKITRLAYNYSSSILMLTVAPTFACNFKCVYCFENNTQPVFMSDDTEEKLIDFIKKYSSAQYIGLSWFGGEPLLCFDRMKTITQKIKNLNKKFSAILVTNGYLLSKEKIALLDDLNINTIQITIDGTEDIHNRRRSLKNGHGTYLQILENIDILLKNWKGKLDIRVNIDHSNNNEYHLIHEELINRFEKLERKRLRIYPGIVHDNENLHPDVSCFKDRSYEAIFNMEQYHNHGIDDFSFFPTHHLAGCITSRNQGFVIGPEGEIYKCWDDLGIENKIVGSVYSNKNWNYDLIANYQVGASYLDDPECKECFYLPVCDGGCVYVRLQNYLNHKCKNVCTKFKDHLEGILEIYYELKNNTRKIKEEELLQK